MNLPQTNGTMMNRSLFEKPVIGGKKRKTIRRKRPIRKTRKACWWKR